MFDYLIKNCKHVIYMKKEVKENLKNILSYIMKNRRCQIKIFQDTKVADAFQGMVTVCDGEEEEITMFNVGVIMRWGGGAGACCINH